ncbi:Single-stranded DNA-binding protein WHY1, chloroplastic [Vitis vinifera]|uniref:Single-stranded DNA-binding protein WHY1, chloroplastic n=1 Tax=Vitis vinifera TaxID=29760 RepID=A0A438CRY6_VITVI|nr:Single-stranded DNA-binding protein WHY1, chloroplastic [Vitis vinifera]
MHHLHLLSSSFTIQNPRLCPNHSLSSLHSSSPLSFTSRTPLLLSTTRHFRKKRSLQCRQSDYFQQQNITRRQPPNDSSFGGGETDFFLFISKKEANWEGKGEPSPAEPNARMTWLVAGALQPRVFVGHSIYKGKAALTVEPKAPEFTPLDSGAFKVSKEGFVLLQFAPAAGVRQYDWGRKQVISNLGLLLFNYSMKMWATFKPLWTEIQFGVKDLHYEDYNNHACVLVMLLNGIWRNFDADEEGKVRKVLKVEPLPDGSGHFFNLSVQNKLLNMDENIYIPVTRAEFAVLISAFNFIVPYLLGWHAYANSIKPDDTSRVNNANPRSGDFEWSR